MKKSELSRLSLAILKVLNTYIIYNHIPMDHTKDLKITTFSNVVLKRCTIFIRRSDCSYSPLSALSVKMES